MNDMYHPNLKRSLIPALFLVSGAAAVCSVDPSVKSGCGGGFGNRFSDSPAFR